MRVGKPHIFGRVCQRHPELNGERFASHGCLWCIRDKNRVLRKEHPERQAAYTKKYVENNRDKVRERRQRHSKKNAASLSAYTKEWRKKNLQRDKERTNAWRKANWDRYIAGVMSVNAKRRTLCRRQQLAKIYSKELREIYRNCPPGHHVDHIVPLRGETVCGLHVPWNLQYLPEKENLSKGNKIHWRPASL